MIIQEDEQYQMSVEEDGRVVINGSLRLNGMAEYAPIIKALEQAITEQEHLVLDISNLNFLNSSGIAMLSKFIIYTRNQKDKQLTIKGSSKQPWQSKSLNNLKRLMPQLELVIE